jgi:hypothetical protein
MSEQDQQHDQARLRQLLHDIQHCLHVIGMVTELLRGVRDDADKFAGVCGSIDKERRGAGRRITAFQAA